MQQIVDLQNSAEFNALDIKLVSLATDDPFTLTAVGAEYGVTTPLLSDETKAVSTEYGVMRWATAGGEPSHTFVLVGADGKVAWVQDYGHADNGGRMYVPLDELLGGIRAHLQ